MIAINDSFWLNSLAYVLLITKFRDHPSYTDLIDLFHLVRATKRTHTRTRTHTQSTHTSHTHTHTHTQHIHTHTHTHTHTHAHTHTQSTS